MAVNRVIYNGTTLIDLTSVEVYSSTLKSGKTAYNKAGEKITGTLDTSLFSNRLTGNGYPSDNLGDDGDIYIDLDIASVQS